MWLIGTLVNCIDDSMVQGPHCDVTDTSGAPRIIPLSTASTPRCDPRERSLPTK
jgi:hypothetical protein